MEGRQVRKGRGRGDRGETGVGERCGRDRGGETGVGDRCGREGGWETGVETCV